MEKQKPNTIVIRPLQDGGIKFEHVPRAEGQTWFYTPDNKFYHLMILNGYSLEAYEPPDEITQLPDKLYRALHPESIKRMFTYKGKLMDKINAWLGIAAIGIFGFLIIVLLDMV